MPNLPIEELKGRRIGRALIKLGKVTREQVHEALSLQQSTKKGELLGRIMIELGLISEDDLLMALAGQKGIDFVDLSAVTIDPAVVESLRPESAITYQVMPIEFDAQARSITVAMKNPENFSALDDLKMLLGFRRVNAVVARPAEIDALIAKHYAGKKTDLGKVFAEAANAEGLKGLANRGESIDLANLVSAAGDNKIVDLVNQTLMIAIRDKASDVHFEPFEDEFKVRYRIDGVLYEMHPLPKHLAMAVCSRVKVMSKLDIAERRLPQDGRIELTIGDTPIDLRVAVLPTMFGESVVMRILDRSNVQLSLDKVGFRPDELEKVRGIIQRPNGIVVVTGPTGSGKTTTLYAALNDLNQPDVKILTAEDPVEYDIAGLIQCQVNTDQELTFARLLRSFLRQDPDIILVGEVRDLETAQIAIQASLTGHLVFTTLHTNDAPSTILRLVDLGVESFLLTATIEAIIAQRLVRRICVKCKVPFVPSEEQLLELALRPNMVEGRTFFRGKGCDSCLKTGYRARMALFEIMQMDDGMRELIMKQASTTVIRNEAKRRGMRTLRESGLLGIFDGLTTLDEVVRETIVED